MAGVTMKGIVMHWDGGGGVPSRETLNAYHAAVSRDGKVHYGKYKPEHNLSTADGHYAAHTRAMNTGWIGLAVCGMYGAKERPFSWGPSPLTWGQINVFTELVAEFALTYKIPVTRKTVLTHAEVQPTLGVWQRNKWDIRVLPGMEAVGDPIEIGDRLRNDIRAHVDKALKATSGRIY